MRLVKLEGHDGPIWINPEHVVAVRKALKDTKVETVSGMHMVKEAPEVVARLLGADELAKEINAKAVLTYEPE
ncbi:MAG: hypothetical protein ACOVO5_00230 [Devosia sp.]|jgi:hypothetical protein|uniref:hypothetical protein n=1 Tax=Devosia sp. TaxID=1871048 RepID=UPI0037C06855